jgi:hypothetical protein
MKFGRILAACTLAATMTLTSGCGTLLGIAIDTATDGDGSAVVAGAALDVAIAGEAIESATHHDHDHDHERHCR